MPLLASGLSFLDRSKPQLLSLRTAYLHTSNGSPQMRR